MRISKLSLIDTYGLDHSQQANSDVLIERYNKIFNVDYPDITVVFYIVALHKGTSNDLQQAISVLYEQRPDLMSYIVGTYIDENDLSEYTKKWLIKYEKNTEQKPNLQGQIIDYLYADEIILGLINNGISENMALQRTEVMRNRFAPFCGKKEVLESNEIMKTMNTTSIDALLFSINNLEHLGSNYINIDMILSKLESSSYLNRFIEKFIEVATRRFREIFCKAQSRTKGKIRTNLQKFVLGFDGSTLDATWKRIFRDAYNEVFTKEIELGDKKSYSLADDFGLEGNMKVAFNEILNSFFREWFIRDCIKGYNNIDFMSEVDCTNCCSKQSFIENCIWGVFINCVGIKNMQNKPEDNSVQEWLCDIHNIDQKINDTQLNTIVEIFKLKFRNSFINMCRTHNSRIMSQKITSVQENQEFFQIKEEHMKRYIDEYDKNIEMDKLNHQVSIYLSR